MKLTVACGHPQLIGEPLCITEVILIELIGLLLLLDLISGVVHWAEDTFWNESTPVIGSWLINPNELHHRDPSAFLRNTWLQSSWDLLLVGAVVLGISIITNSLTWQLVVFVAIGANANQIHKWNHSPRDKIPVAIRVLQKVRLLQNQKDHQQHHSGKVTAYPLQNLLF